MITGFTVAWMIFMRPFTPPNIIQFEFANTVEKAQSIMDEWGTSGVAAARLSIYLDFVFLILYSWSISLGCKVVIASMPTIGWKKAGEYLSTTIWFAGSCDLIENFAMLFTLSNMNEFSVSAAYYFAMFKFAVVIVCLLFIITSPVIKLLLGQRK